jgi:hypothetical protein
MTRPSFEISMGVNTSKLNKFSHNIYQVKVKFVEVYLYTLLCVYVQNTVSSSCVEWTCS